MASGWESLRCADQGSLKILSSAKSKTDTIQNSITMPYKIPDKIQSANKAIFISSQIQFVQNKTMKQPSSHYKDHCTFVVRSNG